jgi:hypothetical protein
MEKRINIVNRILLGVFLAVACSLNAYSVTYTAVGCPGPINWNGMNATSPFYNGAIQLTSQPINGDVLVIPAGCTVTVTDDIDITNAVTLNIYGTLKFITTSDKLRFDNIGSILSIFVGGAITAPSNSNQIKIGNGAAEWSGPGTLSGPAVISNGFLPVELIDFTANCISNGVELNWSTASENNNDYFLIERSANGIDYHEVAKISGNTNSSSVNHYSYILNENADDLTYYRLTQVDKTGERKVFAANSLQCKNTVEDILIIYPNPAKSEINVLLNTNVSSEPATIKVENIFGEVILELKINITNELNLHSIPLNMGSGTYYVTVLSDHISVPSQKVVIMN